MNRAAVVMVAAVLAAGCSSTNITELKRAQAELMDAMGRDPATVCVTASYGPANLMAARTNIVNGDIKCTPSGLEVKSQASQVGVPMTITPQLSIGNPTLVQPPPGVLVPNAPAAPGGVQVNPPR